MSDSMSDKPAEKSYDELTPEEREIVDKEARAREAAEQAGAFISRVTIIRHPSIRSSRLLSDCF